MGQECQKCKAFSVKEEFDIKNMDEELGDESPDVEQSFLDEEDEVKKHSIIIKLKEKIGHLVWIILREEECQGRKKVMIKMMLNYLLQQKIKKWL